MNEDDDNLIAKLANAHSQSGHVEDTIFSQAAQRLRELLTPDDNKGSIPAVINAPPCDAARECAKQLFKTKMTEGNFAAIIQSALTAHGEAVRERCAKVAQDEADFYEKERLEFIKSRKYDFDAYREGGWQIHAKRNSASNIAALIAALNLTEAL